MPYNLGVIVLVILIRPRTLARLLPELCSTKPNYYYLSNNTDEDDEQITSICNPPIIFFRILMDTTEHEAPNWMWGIGGYPVSDLISFVRFKFDDSLKLTKKSALHK